MPADDLALPPDIARLLKGLQDQIDALKRSNQLLASTISEGKLTILNSGGAPLVFIGKNVVGARYGVAAANGANYTFAATDRGLELPHTPVPFESYVGNRFIPVTSGSFITVWTSWVGAIPSVVLEVNHVVVGADAATTGEVRLTVTGTGFGLVSNTSAKTCPAGVFTNTDFRWLHAVTVGAGPYLVNVEARRTGGAGNINVYCPPNGYFIGSDGPVSEASIGGIFS